MNSILLVIVHILSSIAVVPSENIAIKDHNETPLMQFETNLIELGEIKRGDIKKFQFEFVNKGNEDVEIEFMSSCDCTTLDYPMSPIAPGEGGTIEVIFDSKEKTKSETVDIDIDLVNTDPITNNPIFIRINYSFILIE